MNLKRNKIRHDFIYEFHVLTKRQNNYRMGYIKCISALEYTFNVSRQMQPLAVSLAVAFRT